MGKQSQRVVLITGAASGIGRETAYAFAKQGATLELVDIDEVGLATTARESESRGARVRTHKVDVSSAEQMAALAELVHTRHEALDVLVNNAGVGLFGSFIGTELEAWDWAIGINIKGVVHGCHFFVPKMIARKQGGHVLNVASAAGFSAAKMMPVYSTTKFAVVGMSDSLRSELRPHRIHVTTVCPGVINTPITRNMRTTGNMAGRTNVHDRASKLYRLRNYGPHRVANAMLKAVERGHSGILPVSPEAWLMWWGGRASPRILEAVLSNVSV